MGPVAVPVATALAPGGAAPPANIAAALARSLAPPEAEVSAPDWLWPSQRVAYRRAVAAICGHGGALVADAVGTGKTYVALAAAQRVNGHRPTVCLVPAALRAQWEAAALRVGVPIVSWTHQRVSRGSLPPHTGQLVVIDESHRYRNPITRGYRLLAPWLVGHRALMLSATPVVNRLEDLAHQLALAVRDDALAAHGVASIGSLLAAGTSHSALALVVLVTAHAPVSRPWSVERTEAVAAGPDALERRLAEIDRLTLSRSPPIAALVRSLFWRAAGSSAAALAGTLRRYRRLLLHARDAHAGGREPARRTLIRMTAGLSDQLLMWELLPNPGEPMDLVVADLPRLDALITETEAAAESDDPKLERLRDMLADGRRTLVFSVSRETVRWLRSRLGHRVAWCMGERAGVGTIPGSRRDVLAWFAGGGPAQRPGLDGRLIPVHLVTTDVAAEGLDLQGAERVVHYDLPWTPMRLEQRRGRVVRAGSQHRRVETVRFDPPAALERRLRQTEVLARKSLLPCVAGLSTDRGSWRWRGSLAERFDGATATRGLAAVTAGPAGILAGFTIHPWQRRDAPPLTADVLWWDANAAWVDAAPVLEHRLDAACRAVEVPPDRAACRRALEQLGAQVRERLRAIRRAAWESPAPAPAVRAVLARLDGLARSAARSRHVGRLLQVQRAIAFAAGGHTAGERRELERLAAASDAELRAALAGLPAPTPIPAELEARVTGVILFLGTATFPPCSRSGHSCSISMER